MIKEEIIRRFKKGIGETSQFQNELLRNPLILYVPKEAQVKMNNLLKEIKELYRIVYLWEKPSKEIYYKYSIVCLNEKEFALCYWFIGQMWAMQIQEFINERVKGIK